MPQCGPRFDLLCEKQQWLLQRYLCRHLLCLRPTLLQWDLQRVLPRYRLQPQQHLRQQSHLCLRQRCRVYRNHYLCRWLVLPKCKRLRPQRKRNVLCLRPKLLRLCLLSLGPNLLPLCLLSLGSNLYRRRVLPTKLWRSLLWLEPVLLWRYLL